MNPFVDRALRKLGWPVVIGTVLLVVWAVLLCARPTVRAASVSIDSDAEPVTFVQSSRPSPFAVRRPHAAPTRHLSAPPVANPIGAVPVPATMDLPTPQYLPTEWNAGAAAPVTFGLDDPSYNR